MEIRYLNEFRVLAEICNYQEAADRLYISLSTLSKHISKLEAELGTTLFTRSTRKVSLNKYGEAFYHYAVEITNSYHACTNRLEELQLDDALALRISFTPPLTEYCLPRLLEDFMDEHPDIRVSITEHAEPRHLLEEKLCDVAFQTQYSLSENKSAEPAADNRLDLDTLVAVLPLGHPLSGKESVSIKELKKDRFVIQNDPSSELSKIFHRLCAGAGFEPDIACAVRYVSAMPRMAAACKGVTITNRIHTAACDPNEVSVVDLYPAIPFCAQMLSANDKKHSIALQCFRTYFQEAKARFTLGNTICDTMPMSSPVRKPEIKRTGM